MCGRARWACPTCGRWASLWPMRRGSSARRRCPRARRLWSRPADAPATTCVTGAARLPGLAVRSPTAAATTTGAAAAAAAPVARLRLLRRPKLPTGPVAGCGCRRLGHSITIPMVPSMASEEEEAGVVEPVPEEAAAETEAQELAAEPAISTGAEVVQVTSSAVAVVLVAVEPAAAAVAQQHFPLGRCRSKPRQRWRRRPCRHPWQPPAVRAALRRSAQRAFRRRRHRRRRRRRWRRQASHHRLRRRLQRHRRLLPLRARLLHRRRQ